MAGPPRQHEAKRATRRESRREITRETGRETMGIAPDLAGSARAVPRAVWAGAASTLVGAVGALALLLATGHDLPPAPAFLVFVALFALSTNHDVVFPAEYAASADLAVVVASVVAFRHDGAFVGPLLLGLVAGPLDVVHWRRRAFVQMAWNSGGRACTALAGAAAFAAVAATAGSSVPALVGAAGGAVVGATVVDTGLSLALVMALGGSLRQAWRAVRDVDVLQVPLMCAGAAAGFLATAVGVRAVVPPMVAVVLLPEIVQARLRVPGVLARDLLLALEVAVTAAVVVPFVGVPDPLTIGALVAVAVLVGVELAVDGRAVVPGVLGAVVVTAALTVAGGDGVFTGLLVGGLATAVSWRGARAGGLGRAGWAVVVAAAAGATAGAVADEAHALDAGAWLLGVVAVATFAALAVAVARRDERVREAGRVLWSFPLVAGGVAAGLLVGSFDGWARVVPFVGLGVTALGAAWCGATPWRSRVLSRRLANVRGGVRGVGRAALLGAAVAASACAGVAGLLAGGRAHIYAALVVVGAGELAVAMGLTAARQWRFAPRARARDAALLGAAGALIALAALGVANRAWWSLPVLAVALFPTLALGRAVAAHSDRVDKLAATESEP